MEHLLISVIGNELLRTAEDARLSTSITAQLWGELSATHFLGAGIYVSGQLSLVTFMCLAWLKWGGVWLLAWEDVVWEKK